MAPLPCVTTISFPDLAFCVASLASRQDLRLSSTSNRRSKVRQRPPSCLQQPPPLSAGLATLPVLSDRKHHVLPKTASGSCGAVEPPRNDVRAVRVSQGGGSTSGGGDTVQTQKSLMDAGNRRRWTEVRAPSLIRDNPCPPDHHRTHAAGSLDCSVVLLCFRVDLRWRFSCPARCCCCCCCKSHK